MRLVFESLDPEATGFVSVDQMKQIAVSNGLDAKELFQGFEAISTDKLSFEQFCIEFARIFSSAYPSSPQRSDTCGDTSAFMSFIDENLVETSFRFPSFREL